MTVLNRYDKAALALVLAMLAILLWVSRFHEIGGYGVETDFYGSYAFDAGNLLRGKALEEPDHGPVYTFALAGFMLVFGEAFSAAKMISILSAVGFGWLAFRTLRALFDAQLAFFTVLPVFLSLAPHAILASQDVFLAFWVALAVFLTYRRGRITRGNLFWSGLVSALALLTRYDAAVVPLGVGLSILLLNPEGQPWSRRLQHLGVYGAAFLLLFLPWLGFNWVKHGHPLPTRLYTAVGAYYYGGFENRIGGEGMQFGAEQFDSLSDVILGDPIHFVGRYLKTGLRHAEKMMLLVLKFPAYLVFLPGVILFLAAANRRQVSLFTFPLLGFLILCLTIFNPRYYLYFLPFLFFFVVRFCFAPELWGQRMGAFPRRTLAPLLAVVFALVLAFQTLSAVRQTHRNISGEPIELVEVAKRLREVAAEDDLIIARKPHLGYLAGLRTAYFPEVDTVGKLMDYARAIGARFVLYSGIEAEMRPQLRRLMHPKTLPSGWRLVVSMESPPVRLYEIAGKPEGAAPSSPNR